MFLGYLKGFIQYYPDVTFVAHKPLFRLFRYYMKVTIVHFNLWYRESQNLLKRLIHRLFRSFSRSHV